MEIDTGRYGNGRKRARLKDMAWLVTEGRVLASCESVTRRRAKSRGLLGRDGIEGALVTDGLSMGPHPWDALRPRRRLRGRERHRRQDVHMRRHRTARPCGGPAWVIEAQEGASVAGDCAWVMSWNCANDRHPRPRGDADRKSRRSVPRAVATLQQSSLILCEDTRHSGKLLSHAGISGVRLAVCNEHTETERSRDVLSLLEPEKQSR